MTATRQTLALSADGTHLAFVADGRLYLRSMVEFEARAIPGTDAAASPVFSPDGQSLVFWTADRRSNASLSSAACPSPSARQVCAGRHGWSNDGILFVQQGTGIMRVSPNGGEPECSSRSNRLNLIHGPQLLPDGKTLLFTLAARGATGGDRWDHARSHRAVAQDGRAEDPR